MSPDHPPLPRPGRRDERRGLCAARRDAGAHVHRHAGDLRRPGRVRRLGRLDHGGAAERRPARHGEAAGRLRDRRGGRRDLTRPRPPQGAPARPDRRARHRHAARRARARRRARADEARHGGRRAHHPGADRPDGTARLPARLPAARRRERADPVHRRHRRASGVVRPGPGGVRRRGFAPRPDAQRHASARAHHGQDAEPRGAWRDRRGDGGPLCLSSSAR